MRACIHMYTCTVKTQTCKHKQKQTFKHKLEHLTFTHNQRHTKLRRHNHPTLLLSPLQILIETAPPNTHLHLHTVCPVDNVSCDQVGYCATLRQSRRMFTHTHTHLDSTHYACIHLCKNGSNLRACLKHLADQY